MNLRPLGSAATALLCASVAHAESPDALSRSIFPFELNTVTRGYYETMATIETGQRSADMRAILRTPPDPAAIARLSKDPADHSIMHTTCVSTRLEGGHANNALPQRAAAVVNCRTLPGDSPEGGATGSQSRAGGPAHHGALHR